MPGLAKNILTLPTFGKKIHFGWNRSSFPTKVLHALAQIFNVTYACLTITCIIEIDGFTAF